MFNSSLSRKIVIASLAAAGPMLAACGPDGSAIDLRGIPLDTQALEEAFVSVQADVFVDWTNKQVRYFVKNRLPNVVECDFSISVEVRGADDPNLHGFLTEHRSADRIFPTQQQELVFDLSERYALYRDMWGQELDLVVPTPALVHDKCRLVEEPGGGEEPSEPEDWIALSGGTFRMGSRVREGKRDERPRHRVTIEGFQLRRTETTVGEYRKCVDAGACTPPDTAATCNWSAEPDGREEHPINCTDWYQARTYCLWLGARLPSEAEWEYAARSGGQDVSYPWGEQDPDCDRVVMKSSQGPGCGLGRTSSVCSVAAGNTSQGICDMAGNVWEWVQDWYHRSYENAPTTGHAWQSPEGTERVNRGGSWISSAGAMRVADRSSDPPESRYRNVGFRCAQ